MQIHIPQMVSAPEQNSAERSSDPIVVIPVSDSANSAPGRPLDVSVVVGRDGRMPGDQPAPRSDISAAAGQCPETCHYSSLSSQLEQLPCNRPGPGT